MTGTGSVTLTWDAVPGATTTALRVSRHRTMQHARTVAATGRTGRITRLVDGRTYWVDVTVRRTRGRTAVRSAAVRVRPAAGAPLAATGVRAVPGTAAHQVRVTWTGGDRATALAVVAGSDPLVTQRVFSSRWLPATTRSLVFRVPERFRDVLGAGTGNPVHVRIVEINGDDRAAAPRTSSLPGAWTAARSDPPSAAGSALRVAEWNVQSVGATAGFTESHRWPARAPKVAAMIQAVHPDLLLTSELSTSVVDGCRNTRAEPLRCEPSTQVADLAARLPGLRLAGTDAYRRIVERRTAHPEWAPALTNGAHVLYDPARLELLDHGYLAPAMRPEEGFENVTGLGVTGWTGAQPIGSDRWLSWAELRTRDAAGRRFVAVAAHYPVGADPVVVAARAEETAKVLAAIDRIAGDLPVVFGGDVNDDPVRNVPAVQPAFVRAGWFDASATTGPRTNARLGTSAITVPDAGDPGYGRKPLVYRYPAGRLDFILLKRSASSFRYDNLQPLLPSGAVDPALQGSDHAMQLATIGIGDPVR